MKAIPTIVVAVTLVSLIGCKSSTPPSVMAPAPRMLTVEVLDNSYNPQQIQINSGDTVRWVLVGAATNHTVTSLGMTFDSGLVFQQPGDFYDQTFNQNNLTFEYSCINHGQCTTGCTMKGSVLVGGGAPPPMTGY